MRALMQAGMWLCITLVAVCGAPALVSGEPAKIFIDEPMSPPLWALLERELLRANADACREFFDRYFDERGYLLCVERWGGDDGPDDAIENCLDWPILHALGANDDILSLYKKAWEGHLRQYTLAKTVEVPFARDGMYYKEFPVMMDWMHNGEGLVVFNLQGLSDPGDPRFAQRVKRFAGFYLNEDPGAQNYDPEQKIIKSLFNGSRGPLLRKATAVDWAGDPIEVENRFKPHHGETSYAQMLEHFKDYNDIVGDHPQNLRATTLVLNAYMLTQDEKYRRWILEYVDAWRERMLANNNIIPTKIGLDGTVGGDHPGRWWGGVYGWGFSMFDPATKQPNHRNRVAYGFQGFMNAYLLTGDDKYLDPWRKQLAAVNSNKKLIDGVPQYPHMYGEKGWYNFTPEKFGDYALDLAYCSLRADDLAEVADYRWVNYLAGRNPDFPEQALRRDLARLRTRVQAIRDDASTPDTRLSDDSMRRNPASIRALLQLMCGGLHPENSGAALYCGLRYFDPLSLRAGLPEDVAALVDELTPERLSVTLVNLNQVGSRTLVVQAGGYGEHHFSEAKFAEAKSTGAKRAEAKSNGTKPGEESLPLDGSFVTIALAPGAGARLTFSTKRFVNQPTLLFPWDD